MTENLASRFATISIFLSYTPAGTGTGHPDYPGAAGPSGREQKTICTHVLNRGPLGVRSPADIV